MAKRAPKRRTKAVSVEGPTLRAIDQDLRDITSAIIEADGELTPEVEAKLEALEGEREQKLESYALVRRNMLGEADRAELHRKFYAGQVDRWKRAAERLKEFAHQFMRFGEKPLVKVKTGLVSAYRQRNPRPTFVCDDPRSLPDEFRLQPPMPEPVLRDDVALSRWRLAFDRILEERCGLMGEDERAAYILTNLQALADEAARLSLPDGIRVVYEEHLRM